VSGRDILKLALGFRKFRERYFSDNSTDKNSLYDKLFLEGQAPKTLVIGCSDSRVDPALLCSAAPGDLFVVRHVASLVPPFEESGTGYHGISSAIEFAVVNLKVENVIIFGHRQCGGIRALLSPEDNRVGGFVRHWVQIAESARTKVLEAHPNASLDELCQHCEKEATITSLNNLKSFPFVQEAIRDRNLSLIALYFDLEKGQLSEYSETEDDFKLLQI
jgi:carbonic anhydrase